MSFFEYYSEFDFGKYGISLIEGTRVVKPTEFSEAAVYIENPLERDLNVAKNVQDVYVEQFQTECRAAVNALLTSDGAGRKSLLSILSMDDNDSNDTTTDKDSSITDSIDNDNGDIDGDSGDGNVEKSRNRLNFNEFFSGDDAK